MGKRKDSIRGRVISAWESADKPDWSIQKTKEECIIANNKSEEAGLCPAPQFRKAIKSQDNQYIRNWVGGCHFPWINPR